MVFLKAFDCQSQNYIFWVESHSLRWTSKGERHQQATSKLFKIFLGTSPLPYCDTGSSIIIIFIFYWSICPYPVPFHRIQSLYLRMHLRIQSFISTTRVSFFSKCTRENKRAGKGHNRPVGKPPKQKEKLPSSSLQKPSKLFYCRPIP